MNDGVVFVEIGEVVDDEEEEEGVVELADG